MSALRPPLKWEDNMPFGKYKGKGIGEVIDDDPRYIHWLINNTDCQFIEEIVDYVDSQVGAA